jgi:hypothetical protein
LKPATKPKPNTNHAGRGPRRGGPDGPPRRPIRRPPRVGSASLEGARLPRAGSVPFEGERLPRAGSASLEGPLRPRTGSASLEGTPRMRACSCAQALNALTSAGRRHHVPGARAPVPPHQLPRREPIPITVGGGGELCGAAGASLVTPLPQGTDDEPPCRRGRTTKNTETQHTTRT